MAVQSRRSEARQLLEEARLIGEHARAVLVDAGRGDDVAHQVSEMVAQAVHRALQQLNGGIPSRQASFDNGGRYKFSGRVDDSPPAQTAAAPRRPPDMAEPPEIVDVKADEKPRDRNDAVPWVL